MLARWSRIWVLLDPIGHRGLEQSVSRAPAERTKHLKGGVAPERLRVAVLSRLQALLPGMDMISALRPSQHGGVLMLEAA